MAETVLARWTGDHVSSNATGLDRRIDLERVIKAVTTNHPGGSSRVPPKVRKRRRKHRGWWWRVTKWSPDGRLFKICPFR